MDKVFGSLLSKAKFYRRLVVSFEDSGLFLLHFLYVSKRGELIFFLSTLFRRTCFQNRRFRPSLLKKLFFLFLLQVNLMRLLIRALFRLPIITSERLCISHLALSLLRLSQNRRSKSRFIPSLLARVSFLLHVLEEEILFDEV